MYSTIIKKKLLSILNKKFNFPFYFFVVVKRQTDIPDAQHFTVGHL